MPKRGERSVEIVHSSFIDLLFGAFGAFVLIMIMYVIITMNMRMLPDEIRNIVNKYAKANGELKEQVQDLKEKAKDRDRLKKENIKLNEELRILKKNLTDTQDQLATANGRVEKLKSEIDRIKKEMAGSFELLAKIDKLKKEKDVTEEQYQNALKKNKELQTKLATIKDKYEDIKSRFNKGQRSTAHEWLKYLFLLFLYILASELCFLLDRMEQAGRMRILREDGAELAFDPVNNTWVIRGGKPDTVEKINKVSRHYTVLRTLLWLGIMVAGGYYLVRYIGMSVKDIWIPATVVIFMYAYLRKRFALL